MAKKLELTPRLRMGADMLPDHVRLPDIGTDHAYLADLLLEKELVTGYESREYGFTIESVDGILLDWSKDGAYWALYVGEEYATTGISSTPVYDGSTYKLEYTRFE